MTGISDWLSPEQLATELSRPGQEVTADWIRRQMRNNRIPSVKVGNKRWFTPACREQMEHKQSHREPVDISGFGRAGRRRAS